MRTQPGEERLLLRAAFQNVTGARKSSVLLIVAMIAVFLMALIYGIATTGRFRQKETTGTEAITPGGGEWLKKIPDTPLRAPEPPVPTPPKVPIPPAHPYSPPPPVPPARAPVTAGSPPPSPEEQFRLEREKKRREALLAAMVAPPVAGNMAGTGSTEGMRTPTAVLPGGTPEATPEEGRLSRMMNPFSTGESREEDQNRQAEKAAFLKAAAARNPGYLNEARTPPLGEFEVKAGSIIPAVLLSGINSDLPGAVVAQVRETVYDYVSARHMLIPQGSRLVGRYDSQIAYGQERVLVVWERILFPDGSSLMLQGMPGTDSIGQGGSADQVDGSVLNMLFKL